MAKIEVLLPLGFELQISRIARRRLTTKPYNPFYFFDSNDYTCRVCHCTAQIIMESYPNLGCPR